jgi:hypothetical protein
VQISFEVETSSLYNDLYELIVTIETSITIKFHKMAVIYAANIYLKLDVPLNYIIKKLITWLPLEYARRNERNLSSSK